MSVEEHAGDDYCYLTTTGRATGRPHRIEIWFAYHDWRDTALPVALDVKV